MKIGLGFYARMATRDNMRFANQVGAEAIVLHMGDYRSDLVPHSHFDADAKGRDVSAQRNAVWSVAELRALRQMVESEGLELAALENLNPAMWDHVLLDGPDRERQLANVGRTIRHMAEAGIFVLGYNFTLAGVQGRIEAPLARGGARTAMFDARAPHLAEPLPLGQVWNRVVDNTAPPGFHPPISASQLWDRHRRFLEAVLPVAEECGVTLAGHPDDPPVERLRDQPRLVNRPELLRAMLDSRPSSAHALEFCVGSVAEMTCSDLYAEIDRYSREGRIAYVHCRNVQGRLPRYVEVFLDEGDIDMARVLGILHRNGFKGVVIPDHTPLPDCEGPWHTGMAWAMGWLRATRAAVLREAQIRAAQHLPEVLA